MREGLVLMGMRDCGSKQGGSRPPVWREALCRFRAFGWRNNADIAIAVMMGYRVVQPVARIFAGETGVVFFACAEGHSDRAIPLSIRGSDRAPPSLANVERSLDYLPESRKIPLMRVFVLIASGGSRIFVEDRP